MIDTLIQAHSSLSQIKNEFSVPLIFTIFPLYSHLSLTLFKANLLKRVIYICFSFLNNYSHTNLASFPSMGHTVPFSLLLPRTTYNLQNAKSKGYFLPSAYLVFQQDLTRFTITSFLKQFFFWALMTPIITIVGGKFTFFSLPPFNFPFPFPLIPMPCL